MVDGYVPLDYATERGHTRGEGFRYVLAWSGHQDKKGGGLEDTDLNTP